MTVENLSTVIPSHSPISTPSRLPIKVLFYSISSQFYLMTTWECCSLESSNLLSLHVISLQLFAFPVNFCLFVSFESFYVPKFAAKLKGPLKTIFWSQIMTVPFSFLKLCSGSSLDCCSPGLLPL